MRGPFKNIPIPKEASFSYTHPFDIPEYSLKNFEFDKSESNIQTLKKDDVETIKKNKELTQKLDCLKNEKVYHEYILKKKNKEKIDKLSAEISHYKHENKKLLRKHREFKEVQQKKRKQILADAKECNLMTQNLINLTVDICKAFLRFDGEKQDETFNGLSKLISKQDLELTGEGHESRCPELQNFLDSLYPPKK